MTKDNELRWRRTDESVYLAHCLNHCELYLFYARIYTKGMGFEFSQTNQLIHNLKKSLQSSSPELYYKRRAIQQFAKEVITLFDTHLSAEQSLTLIPIPPSKARSHPEYDDRIEQVAKAVEARFENIAWLPLLYINESRESYHSRSDRRDPDEIYELMQIKQATVHQYQPGSIIAVLDDVLTSGAHFMAARRRILEVFPDADVVGIFWVKAVSPEDFLDD